MPDYSFSVFRYASLTVSKIGFAVIDTNKYGLSPTLAGEVVQAKVFFDHIEFFHDHHAVGSFRRSYKTNDEIYDWTQYVATLCKKTRAMESTKAITSNLEFSQWNTVFGDNRLTAALVDRLIHHSHIVIFPCESYRLTQSMHRQRSMR